MDCISKLPDELLLKILSQLPTTNDVVATMILSKRWQFLWIMVPKLVYDDKYQNIEFTRFSRFVDMSFFLHEAPVIETLHFVLGENCGIDDVRKWIRAADELNVRELNFEFYTHYNSSWANLPRSLYAACRMLVTLKLSYVILLDFTSPISFPTLKHLSLLFVKYPSTEFFNRFLSKCPVLEDLVLKQCPDDNMSICTVRVPSLKSLSVVKYIDRGPSDGFVIDAPSLMRLKFLDHSCGFCVIENVMPKIVTADFDILDRITRKILGFVTAGQHLKLCLPTAKDVYPVGSVFQQLVSLSLCRCNEQWLKLLMRLLEDSPKLRTLKLNQYHLIQALEPSPSWTNPSSVPDCLLSSLEILEWGDYEGTEEEKEVVEYILRNGACLKKVTISSKSTDIYKKLEMLKVLTLSFRRSPTCQLAFN